MSCIIPDQKEKEVKRRKTHHGSTTGTDSEGGGVNGLAASNLLGAVGLSGLANPDALLVSMKVLEMDGRGRAKSHHGDGLSRDASNGGSKKGDGVGELHFGDDDNDLDLESIDSS